MATKKQTMNQGNAGDLPTTGPSGSVGNTGGTSAGQGTMGSTGTGSTGMTGGFAGASNTGISNTGTSGGTIGTSGTGGTGAGTAAARSFYDQAKETAGQAYEVAAEKATTKLEEQKTNLSGGLSSIAGSVRQVSENLRGPDVQDGISKATAQYSELAAKKIEDVANYFEQKDVRQMYSDLEGFARRNPAVFVGGAFTLGLIVARFLKSGGARRGSSQNTFGSDRDRQDYSADFGPGNEISPV